MQSTQSKPGQVYTDLPLRNEKKVWHVMNVVAAVIATIIVIGALISVLHLVQQSHEGTGGLPSSSGTVEQHITLRMDGRAMEPTIHDGAFLRVNTSVYHAHHISHGDIIAFYAPPNPKVIFIKRIIAIPGDIITIKGTTVIVNGKILQEPYVAPKNQGNLFAFKRINNLRVPTNDYFVLGDNRAGSSDSRDWGFVPLKDIIGQVLLPPVSTPVSTATSAQ